MYLEGVGGGAREEPRRAPGEVAGGPRGRARAGGRGAAQSRAEGPGGHTGGVIFRFSSVLGRFE